MLRTLADRAETWVEKHGRVISLVLLAAVLVTALWLRADHVADVPTRGPDERVHAAFAQQLSRNGLGAYRDIFAKYSADPSSWAYPSPARVVHVLSAAAVMTLTGSTNPQAGVTVAFLFNVGSVLLLAALGWRFFGRFVGLAAALLFAAYAADLEFARRAWGESTGTFFSLLVVYASCALHVEPTRWAWRLAFFGAGAACLLVNPAASLAFFACFAWRVGEGLARGPERRAIVLDVASGLASVATAFGVLWLLAGNASHALASVVHGFGISSDPQSASGWWYSFGVSLWLLAPLTIALALIGAGVAIVPAGARIHGELPPGARTLAGLALCLSLGFVLLCTFGHNLQYLRLMAPANPSLCLLAALGARWILLASEDWAGGRMHPIAMVVLPLAWVLTSARDYRSYEAVVVQPGMQDMATNWLLAGFDRRDRRVLDTTQSALEAATPVDHPAEPLPPGADPTSQVASLIERSRQQCQRDQFAECVNTSRAALQIDPRAADAWNNAAVGYGGLALWEDAVRCANMALKLRPDFTLARNNLAWVSEELSRAGGARVP